MFKKICKSVGLFLVAFVFALFIPKFVTFGPSIKNILEIASIQTTTLTNSRISSSAAFRLLKSTVRTRRGEARGSGVIIRTNRYKGIVYNFIITNHHNVREEETIEVETFSYIKNKLISATNLYTGKVIARDQDVDLALIIVAHDSPIGHVSSFVSYDDLEKLSLYDPLFVSGCGLGRPPYITQGHLSMVSDKYYFATAFAIFGNSGGGLYSQKGSLIGIARLITTVRVKIGNSTLSLPEPNLPIFIPSYIIIDWICNSGHDYMWDQADFHKMMVKEEKAARKKFY